ncbi:rRNA maturation RNase YbeY [Halioxenophilus aromaticivorans]|uniref:Endoribonuclease YbeY n=2 Tax=Halioxenophilus aromaticivorans TaxID=1306992 RepID=A0AAV3U4K6_9ALTE
MHLDFQVAIEAIEASLPSEEEFLRWVKAALVRAKGDEELTIRVVGAAESQTLNRDYRGKDKPTNVLSFEADLPDEIEVNLLGDMIICAPVVAQEATEQGKSEQHHWAHMVVHGTLHLQGYDHIEDSDAEVMERLEIEILARLGIANPYRVL